MRSDACIDWWRMSEVRYERVAWLMSVHILMSSAMYSLICNEHLSAVPAQISSIRNNTTSS